MKILVTGFDPFNNQSINPTQLIIEQLPKQIGLIEIIPLLLPTVRFESTNILINSIKKHKPDAVLMLGQASKIEGFHVERVAINIDDFRIKDNHQNQPIDQPIHLDGKSAYFSTLPIKKIVASMNDFGFKSTISNSAGTFVCNHVFYGCAHFIQTTKLATTYGFIHVPFETSQTNSHQFSLPLDAMIKAILIAIQTIFDDLIYDVSEPFEKFHK